MTNFGKALGTVMEQVLARPDNFKVDRDFYNSGALTVTIYGTRAIEITVETNGEIILTCDKDRAEMLYNNNKLHKKFTQFSNGSTAKGITLARAKYGYTELKEFADDFRQF